MGQLRAGDEGALLRNAVGHLFVKVATVVEELPDEYRAAQLGG